ncbi:DUF3679 domain-containing protein [Rossellomorea vietnamensis]|uniref:DUF3679 domain-containing protein n=1 Tax=Rossellomorea vietnamensis TaxID=218284 RepID=A0A5D4MGH5_9BACI|nr:YqxA family protein [Rossellomorea vietnamensis]TYS00813.1 DUF3679 domain-containing protein [Rossellomorea vietnamensis]
MKRFVLKSILLISILFVGVLIGMQKANDGIKDMKGYDQDTLGTPLTISEDETGNVEASLLGQEMGSASLSEKKKKLEEMKSFNFFSEIGKSVAGVVKSLTEKTVEFISSLI